MAGSHGPALDVISPGSCSIGHPSPFPAGRDGAPPEPCGRPWVGPMDRGEEVLSRPSCMLQKGLKGVNVSTAAVGKALADIMAIKGEISVMERKLKNAVSSFKVIYPMYKSLLPF